MSKLILGNVLLAGGISSVCLAFLAAKEAQLELCLAWVIAAVGQFYIAADILTSDD